MSVEIGGTRSPSISLRSPCASHRCAIARMDEPTRQRQLEHALAAIELCDHQATPDELTTAAALLATRPSARQPELDLSKKG